METIVVVDDDLVFGRLMNTVLGLEGYRPVVVRTLEAVIPTVREEEPALLLMDVHMHDRDALGALRDIKRDEVLRHLPVIMTSGMDRAEECLEAGADSFVPKPFRPSELLIEMRELIARAVGDGFREDPGGEFSE